MKIFALFAAAAAFPGAAAQTPSPSAVVLVDTPAESTSGTPTPAPFGFNFPSFGDSLGSSGSPSVLECPEETAAAEACYGDEADMNVNDAINMLACAMCGLTALGTDFMSSSESEYCAEWKPCVEEACPKECQGPMNDLQVCQMGWDCGVGSAGTIFVSLATSFLAVAVTCSLM